MSPATVYAGLVHQPRPLPTPAKFWAEYGRVLTGQRSFWVIVAQPDCSFRYEPWWNRLDLWD